MDLKTVSFIGPTRIGTDLFTSMSLHPTQPTGTQRIELLMGADPPEPFVLVQFKNVEYWVPLTNVAAFVKAEEVELGAAAGITAEEQELGTDIPSGYCSCDTKHYNFEKVCKECSLPIWRKSNGNQEDHQKEGLIGEGPPGELVGGESLPDVEF